MKLIEKSKNVHVLQVTDPKENYPTKLELSIGLFSDLHWDHPKCDRELLVEHFNYCLENNHRIHLNGDTFCFMQGKKDRRGSKGSLRPEHKVDNYFDAVIDDAVEWFKPYAHLIDVVGYGNHETAITRHMEFDPLRTFVDRLNREQPADHKIGLGGYGGWFIVMIGGTAYKIYYYHGNGGGGIVTRGEINLTRALQKHEGFDCFTMGHIHENKETVVVRTDLDQKNNYIERELLLLVTGTYKEEYYKGIGGWHVERGAPPKPVGARLLTLNYKRSTNGAKIKAFSRKF